MRCLNLHAAWTTVPLAILLPLATVGCTRAKADRVPVFPAEGRVLLNSKPLAGALIVLYPKEGVDGRAIPARAQSDREGNFHLTTYEASDGVPTGQYAVTVHYYPLEKHGESYSAGPNSLPAKYSSPKSTDLVVQIREGKNKLPPLTLRQ